MRIVVLALIAALAVAGCTGSAVGAVPVQSTAVASPTSAAAGGSASTDGLVDIGAGIRGPAGLEATVYATGLVNVASLAVDDDGRVWAATAAFDDAGTDTIAMIAAPGAVPVTVIRGQHTVLGLVWVGDTLFVASKERVTAYAGFDGSAFTTTRTVVAFHSGVGEVNTIVMSPAGRLVVGISAPCNACIATDPDSGAIVSFLPDGSDLRVDVSGIRAPVGLAYVPGGSTLYVTMNQRDDLGDATPGDWLAVVEPGQDWGFPDCYGQDGTACAALPKPVAVLDKHAGASGVAIVTGELGPAIGMSAIVAEWSSGTVLGIPLAADGSAASGPATPILTGFSNPVPVILDDGGLLIGDWGTGSIIRIAVTT